MQWRHHQTLNNTPHKRIRHIRYHTTQYVRLTMNDVTQNDKTNQTSYEANGKSINNKTVFM